MFSEVNVNSGEIVIQKLYCLFWDKLQFTNSWLFAYILNFFSFPPFWVYWEQFIQLQNYLFVPGSESPEPNLLLYHHMVLNQESTHSTKFYFHLKRHISDIKNKYSRKPTGKHFGYPSHSIRDLRVAILKQLYRNRQNAKWSNKHLFNCHLGAKQGLQFIFLV